MIHPACCSAWSDRNDDLKGKARAEERAMLRRALFDPDQLPDRPCTACDGTGVDDRFDCGDPDCEFCENGSSRCDVCGGSGIA